MADYESQQFNEMEEDTQKDKFLIFTLGQDFYGIDIKSVTEITGIQKITPVPELPSYVRGVINLRGKIIPIVDVRMRFKMEPLTYDERTCIIIAEISSFSVGLIVDTVHEVSIIKEDEIVLPPEFTGDNSRFIKGIGRCDGEVKLILDCERLLNDEEVETLVEIGK